VKNFLFNISTVETPYLSGVKRSVQAGKFVTNAYLKRFPHILFIRIIIQLFLFQVYPMVVVCIGPLCIPLWPLLAISMKPLWDNFVPKIAKDFMRKSWSRMRSVCCPSRTAKFQPADTKKGTNTMSRFLAISSREDYDHMVAESATAPSVIEFTAEFCGPCKAIKPRLEELATDFEGRVKFFVCDIEENEDLAISLGITSIPAFHMFFRGKKCEELVGANMENLRQSLDKVVARKSSESLSRISRRGYIVL
jgi:thioredoxin 1